MMQKYDFEDGDENLFEVNQQNKLDNFIFCFGKNKDGELSQGQQKIVNRPQHPKGLKKFVFKNISSGYQHTAVVTKTGQLMICGSALHGKLGIQDLKVTNIRSFTVVPSLKGLKTKQVACGDYHTLCLLETGEVYAFGGTLHKKLGQRSGQPAPVQSLLKHKIIKVDCGDYHSVALTEDGQIFSWGGGGNYFNKGQLGHGHKKDIENPERVSGEIKDKFIIDISCGGFHTMALTDQGDIYSWGAGTYGECGYGEDKDSVAPRKVNINFNQQNVVVDEPTFVVESDKQTRIKKISCGGHHSLILTNNGFLYSCGYAYHGQLGLKSTDNQNLPTLVFSLTNKRIVDVSAGWNHSLALTDKGDVYATGHGSSGQLGLGDEDSRTIFTFVFSLGGLNISGIYAGGNHSWVTIDDNEPYIEDFSPPSPLRQSEAPNFGKMENDKSSIKNKSRDASPDTSMMQQAKIEGSSLERVLQVIYSEVDMCHRFIRFTILENKENQFRVKLDEYLKEMYNQETGIQYTKLQNDSELFDENDKKIKSNFPIQHLSVGSNSRSFTLMIIMDPTKNVNQMQENFNSSNIKNNINNKPVKQCCIGDMFLLKEHEVINDPAQKSLGTWFIMFSRLFQKLVEKVKFFELRPYNIMNQ